MPSSAPPLFGDAAGELDALALQLLDGGVHVIAHQVQLMIWTLVSRVCSQFGRWESEDQPPLAGIDAWKPEHVAKEITSSSGIPAEDDRVDTRHHDRASLATTCQARDDGACPHRTEGKSPTTNAASTRVSPNPGCHRQTPALEHAKRPRSHHRVGSSSAATWGLVSRLPAMPLAAAARSARSSTACRTATQPGLG